MRKFLIVCSLLFASTWAQALDCLPKQLNSIFSGTLYTSQTVYGVGEVHSWVCPGVKGRNTFIRLQSTVLVPKCSSIKLASLNVQEKTALISVNSALDTCSIKPQSVQDKLWFSNLQKVGEAEPIRQLEKVQELFREELNRNN